MHRREYPQCVIVVVGSPSGRHDGARVVAGGLAAGIAIEAARGGRHVEIVGRIGDDAAADAILQDLARSGVGHVAILRDQARPTPLEPGPGQGTADDPLVPEADGADVDLALRYLTDFQVLVLVEPAAPSVVEVVVRATAWAEAVLVVAGSTEAAGARLVPSGEGEPPTDYVVRVAALAADLDASKAT
jgi:hypothetical protein